VNVSEAVQVGVLATLSHPPRTEASDIYGRSCNHSVKMHGNLAAPEKGLMF